VPVNNFVFLIILERKLKWGNKILLLIAFELLSQKAKFEESFFYGIES